MAWKFEPGRIKLAREARDLTQMALAALIEATPQQLSAWEVGKVLPGQDSLIKICNALDCPPKFFFVSLVDDNKQQKDTGA